MIDKIDGLGPIRTPQPIKRVSKPGASAGASFAPHVEEESETAATASVATTSSVSGILGLQEVDDALAHASKGKMRAEDILSKLDDLRMDLLTGAISREKLMQLSRIVASRRAQVKDPQLASILDEIDLRAQVELAKYSPV